MTTPPPAADPRSALELIAECIARLRRTDPADTTAALLAAWHGFGAAEAAGALLARDNLEDAVLARNARSVLSAVVRRLRDAPALPYTDPVFETVDNLVPDTPADNDLAQIETSAVEPNLTPTDTVRGGIRALALELNTLLPRIAEHATNPADAEACRHGTRLAYELAGCWDGRLGSFLNTTRRHL